MTRHISKVGSALIELETACRRKKGLASAAEKRLGHTNADPSRPGGYRRPMAVGRAQRAFSLKKDKKHAFAATAPVKQKFLLEKGGLWMLRIFWKRPAVSLMIDCPSIAGQARQPALLAFRRKRQRGTHVSIMADALFESEKARFPKGSRKNNFTF